MNGWQYLGRSTRMQVIASGGFSKGTILAALAQLSLDNIEGAIVGTALYENKLDLTDTD